VSGFNYSRFHLVLFVAPILILLSGKVFSGVKNEIICPEILKNICDIAKIHELVVLQSKIDAAVNTDIADVVARQEEAFSAIPEVPHIAVVIRYLMEANRSGQNKKYRESIVSNGWRHALTQYRRSRSSNSAGEVLDLLDILDLVYENVDPLAAREGLASVVETSQSKNEFTQGFVLAEVGYALGRWGDRSAGLDWLTRAREHARKSSAIGKDGEETRFRLLERLEEYMNRGIPKAANT
jgi:hypothetical protein